MFRIIMPTYKAEPAWFQGALDSVRGQTYRDWELIVIDDNEDDGYKARTREWEAGFGGNPRIRILYNSGTLGAA